MHDNMYDKAIEALKPYMNTFHDRYRFSDWVVKLLIGPCIEIVILHFDAITFEYDWSDDWWEGEKFVRILAAYPLALVEIPTFGYDMQIALE